MLTTVSNGLDKVADAIPLPKQPTKVGIAVVGGMIVFGLVKQVSAAWGWLSRQVTIPPQPAIVPRHLLATDERQALDHGILCCSAVS